MQIKLREAEQNDCDDVFYWKNDEQSRKANFNSNPTPYAVHQEWFGQSLRDPGRFIYIGIDESENKIGIVRLDQRNEYLAEFDINIAPEMRGKGYGAQMIEMACQKFNNKIEGHFFMARVKSDNLASLKAFKKAGFFQAFDYEDIKNGTVIVLLKRQVITKG